MTPLLAASVPLGIGLGFRLWTLLALVPRIGAPRLTTRIAPYLADISPVARDHAARRPAEPMSFLGGLVGPGLRAVRRGLAMLLGGEGSVERRLRQAGWGITAETFRGRQLVSAAIGGALGAVVAAVLIRTSAATPLVPIAVVAVAVAIGLLVPDQILGRAIRARRARIAAELPTVLEFVALALAAGEGILDTLRRVARTGNGDFARELARVVGQVNAGVPLADALHRCADEIQLPALTRAVDQLVGALERGSPLVDVLRSQVQDSRDDAKRLLLEAAGRKEITMLIPLVFLILPVTVAFAIFPGILVLQLGL